MQGWFGLGSLQRVHPESHVHAWTIGEEGGQGGLLKQPKDQDLVPKEEKKEVI